MAKLNASLTVSFNENVTEEEEAPDDLLKNYSFVLEEDHGGADLYRPASAYAQSQAGVPAIFKQSGITNVRLYTAVGGIVKVSGTQGGSISQLGMRQETIREVLTFSGSNSSQTSKGYGIASATIVDKTTFYNKDGYSASSPTQKENGLFEAKEEVYGTLEVIYTVIYRLYRVEYHIPTSIIADMLASNKILDEYSLLPITVLAFAIGGYGATLTLQRRIGGEVIPSKCSGQWLELSGSRKVIEEKVYEDDDIDEDGNPKPGANYSRIEKIIEVTHYCSSDPEQKRILRLNG